MQAGGGDAVGARGDQRQSRVPLLALALALALAFSWLALGTDLPEAQLANADRFATLTDDKSDLHRALAVDTVLVAGYVVLGFGLIRHWLGGRDRDRDHGASAREAGARGDVARLLIATTGLLDLLENGLLAWQLTDDDPDWRLSAVRGVGLSKWVAFTAVVLALAATWRATHRHGYEAHPPSNRPPGADWDPPESGRRVGVCLSGGGIRSAAFSLGVMQVLRKEGWLHEVDYLAAASGGGYLAAGWAVANGRTGPPEPQEPPAWSAGSAEERWFRNHSSYLVPDMTHGAQGVIRLLSGLIINLLLVWLLLFAVVHPVGWIVGSIHPELRSGIRMVRVSDGEAEFTVEEEPLSAATVEVVEDGTGVEVTRYEVGLVPLNHGRRTSRVCVELDNGGVDVTESCIEFAPSQTVLIELRGGAATVLRQPRVAAQCPPLAIDTPCADLRKELEVGADPHVTVVSDTSIPPDELTTRLEVSPARVRPVALRQPHYDPWMWATSLSTIGLGLSIALAIMLARILGTRRREGRILALILVGTGLAWLAVTVVLPWILEVLPTSLTKLGTVGESTRSVLDSGRADYLVTGGGFVAIAITAIRQYLSANKTAGPADNEKKGLLSRFWGALTGHQGKLRWYELTPAKLVAGLAMVVVPVILGIGQLQYATVNGPMGRLVGISALREALPAWLLLPDWARWSIVIGVLVVLWLVADAHAWSLHSFYKQRLSSAYLLERTDGGVRPYDYDKPMPFTAVGDWPGLRRASDEPNTLRLITCCAVNLSEPGVVPPGRRAASFTFSSDWIGGPVVGYVRASDFWDRLTNARRRDITIPAAMSISGAAFSPAMGKQNLGPVGGIMAMANLRLGVWLPHPQWIDSDDVTAQERARLWWTLRRPGWPWFLREVTNRYGFDRRYVYVSDGGHWDNLGLVELLRRGCTEIVCVNAGGDGQESFGTISEAIALAREELGVEVTIDPSPLRPPVEPSATGRLLRRIGSRDRPSPLSTALFVQGSIEYPDGRSGIIWLIEPALTADLPFDVHGFAEAEPVFPDDSTADQVFNHRQFESLRRLGQHQATRLHETMVAPDG